MWYQHGETNLVKGYPEHVDGVSTNYYRSCVSDTGGYSKGSWTIIAYPTNFDGLLMVQQAYESHNGSHFVDIVPGSSRAEIEVIWWNLCLQNTALSYRVFADTFWSFPMIIPKGDYVSARCSSSNANAVSIGLRAYIFPLTLDTISYPTLMHSIGADDTTNSGIEIDPGGTIRTKGDYSEIIDATTHPYQGFRLGFTGTGNVFLSNCDWHIDVAIGSEGNEVDIIQDFRVSSSSIRDKIQPNFTTIFPIAIPEGTRVSARASADITDASDRLVDIILYAFG